MKKKAKIGLALGSGGPRGLAHIGVIKALIENNIKVEVMSGTSVGSMIAAMYLKLGSIEKVEQIFTKLKITELATMFSDVGLRSGIIKGDKLEIFLNKYLGETDISDLSLPYAAVSSNIITGEEVEIRAGSLTKAIRASSSLPGFFSVANLNGKLMIDGGVTQPVPVRAAKNLGADVVIAVNLDQYSFEEHHDLDKIPSATKIGFASIKLLRHSLAQEQCLKAEIVIVPEVAHISWMNLTYEHDRVAIMNLGYLATMKKIQQILEVVTL